MHACMSEDCQIECPMVYDVLVEGADADPRDHDEGGDELHRLEERVLGLAPHQASTTQQGRQTRGTMGGALLLLNGGESQGAASSSRASRPTHIIYVCIYISTNMAICPFLSWPLTLGSVM